jgi:palmitoyltransferase
MSYFASIDSRSELHSLSLLFIFYLYSGPWINNCVGYRNHVHFLLFCIYIVTITVYAVTVARRQFQLVIFHDQILFGIFAPLLQPQTVATAIAEHGIVGPITGVLTLFMFIIDFAATGLVLALFIWQMSLITKGQTCVEEKIHKAIMTNSVNPVHRQRPYDLGWKQNWRTFFEMNSINELLVRFLFPFLFQPKHDGTQWISKDE